MARRISKAEQGLMGWLLLIGLVVGLPVYLFDKVNQSMGWQLPVMVIAALFMLIVLRGIAKKRARLRYLREKYQDEEIVQKILSRIIWVGQTAEQLTDSLGHPVATDRKLLKTKTRDVWKYRHQGANRYGLRITVENGQVSGWESKAG